MSAIPVHIERRFEQRWAARLVPQGTFISPTNLALEPKNSPPRGAGRLATEIGGEEAAHQVGPLLRKFDGRDRPFSIVPADRNS